MVSDKPLPDRCAANVTSRMGLEVHDEELEEVFSTEDRLQSIVLEKGGVKTVEEDPNYTEVYDYFNQGFSIVRVRVTPSDSDTEEDTVTLEIQDDDPDTRHTHTEHEGYCERYPMDSGRCYNHGGTAGPPEGNTNALTHGLRAKRSNYYEQLEEEEKAFVEKMAHSWIDNAPFDKENFAKVNEVYRIAIDQHRLWNAHDEMSDGLTGEQVIGVDDEGNPIEVEEENPVNLAYDRLDRTTSKKLRDLGCLDDPDSQQAEATESLADKFSKLSE